jgi:hypothetical protein
MNRVPTSLLAGALMTACVIGCTARSPATEMHRGTQTERQTIDRSHALDARKLRAGSRSFLDQLSGGHLRHITTIPERDGVRLSASAGTWLGWTGLISGPARSRPDAASKSVWVARPTASGSRR